MPTRQWYRTQPSRDRSPSLLVLKMSIHVGVGHGSPSLTAGSVPNTLKSPAGSLICSTA
jgi:hypothetical protein